MGSAPTLATLPDARALARLTPSGVGRDAGATAIVGRTLGSGVEVLTRQSAYRGADKPSPTERFVNCHETHLHNLVRGDEDGGRNSRWVVHLPSLVFCASSRHPMLPRRPPACLFLLLFDVMLSLSSPDSSLHVFPCPLFPPHAHTNALTPLRCPPQRAAALYDAARCRAAGRNGQGREVLLLWLLERQLHHLCRCQPPRT